VIIWLWTWIDLGSVLGRTWLIATTLKNAKGESVFTNFKPSVASPRGFFYEPDRYERIWNMIHKDLEEKSSTPTLYGSEGELVLLQVCVEPKLLENLLDVLTRLDFPVNPELTHTRNTVVIEFPAWSGRVDEVRKLLKQWGFSADCLNLNHALSS
jgi:hypothetical protein